MGRKITMTGKNAQYIEHRGMNATPDNDREIVMEGDEAVYQEYAYGQAIQSQQQNKSAEDVVKEYKKEAARKLLMDNAEYVEPILANPELIKETRQPVEIINKETVDYSTSIAECFRAPNEFVRQRVCDAVKDCYLGSAAHLALTEIALFDHGLLQKRNSHTAFFKSLVAWGIISVNNEDELKRIVRAIADKHKRLPEEGYKEWSKDYTNEKVICENVGKILGPTIPYTR
ncbi:hypothetical protein [Prevotella communis]|uniref:hypothetical protein n=1 Tax=Prevotella communis TaxID=2913614 RepID=UPI001EDC8BE9|nr:hypothetical protein [Prevotella communis]UKK55727.1 hypothetical protein L6476_09665 [Prevotella communis]